MGKTKENKGLEAELARRVERLEMWFVMALLTIIGVLGAAVLGVTIAVLFK